jgi:hypothetical protein
VLCPVLPPEFILHGYKILRRPDADQKRLKLVAIKGIQNQLYPVIQLLEDRTTCLTATSVALFRVLRDLFLYKVVFLKPLYLVGNHTSLVVFKPVSELCKLSPQTVIT